MLIHDLNLIDVALRAAYKLQQACPWVDFTSGRRTWLEQAHAMAVNTARKRSWVGEVYKKEPEIQAWIDANPGITDIDDLTIGIYTILMSLPLATQNRFAHPAGRAFDLAVPTAQWQEPTIIIIKSLPALEKFLEGEAGLPIWHCSFKLGG